MSKTKKILTTFLICSTVLIIILMTIFMVYFYSVKNSVKFSKENLIFLNSQISMYDSNNQKIEQLNMANKNVITIQEIPDWTRKAFISIEDKQFYSHHGLNYKRIAKAFLSNLKQKSFAQGASTISQQLIKNTHLTNEKTIDRKLKEMILTTKLEEEFSKDEILEMYLNIIYFGENSYGISKASQTYLGKEVSELTISESAMLAGIIKSPATYSPRYHFDKCISRRNLVLAEMKEDGYITEDEYQTAINENIEIVSNDDAKQYSNLYYRATLKEASKILNKSEKEIAMGGYQIFTYYDDEMQSILAEQISSNQYDIPNKFGHIADGLGIVLNNETGGVMAYAGKSKYDLVEFLRQPGSAIKPIMVYAPALEEGKITPESLILDENITIDGYSPHNLANAEHGYVTAKYSVAKSLNIPAVKLMQELGIEKCKDYASKVGIRFDENDKGYALALGGFTQGVTLKDLTNAYLPYACDGQFKSSHFIRAIRSNNGILLFENTSDCKQVFSPETAYLMTDMLVEGVKSGTSKRLSTLNLDIAGKTGTVAIPHTNDNSDAISIAYTKDVTMGVWYGNYSNNKEFVLPHNNNGGTMATQLIADTFDKYYNQNKPENFEMPSTIQKVKIDRIAYDKKQQFWKAPDYMPERFTKEILVSSNQEHLLLDQDYLSCCIDALSINFKDNKTIISFTPSLNFEYEIHRVDELGNDKIIKTIFDQENQVTYHDSNLEYNTKYQYYIVVNCGEKEIYQTSKIIIKTPSKQKALQSIVYKSEKTDDLSFIFQ